MNNTTVMPSKLHVLTTISLKAGLTTDPQKIVDHIHGILQLSTPKVESCKLVPEDAEQLLRLERVKVNVLAHALRFLAIGDFAKRVERMPAPSRLIVERAIEVLKEEFPVCENRGPIAPVSAVEMANAK